MKPIARRALIGLLSGMVSSFSLCLTLGSLGLGLALGALIGIAQIFAFFDLEGGSAIDRAMTSAALGLPFWAIINVILLPVVAGQKPQWTAQEMRALFPALIGWLLFCFFLGILSQTARNVARYFLGPESPPRVPSHPKKTTQVVILGGGFAGVTTAEPGYGNVWALGDCASVPDTEPGKICPPTAQAAIKEAGVVAHNIRATLLGRPPKPFRFKSLGSLCVAGYHTACAEIKGLKFSGLFAWLLWRGVYLSKLPGLERKVRVLADWTLELFFPRDIVQTIDFNEHRMRHSDSKVRIT